ncbi:hypothetical protein BWQ96_06468 [Gracilariopsis chorda]|uniref:C2H2-type domain-containing protein n=1 Tax=Gracilariopsis chorda TaxID=448386 RepID=A0A2V3INW4_9FLOR|nr:hypothetical protein BWQ96_06468 [Gracilariopsis chorda]|eukprot:PXF43775.1 hypothetical protein BWQ96_06468 [Gracilariopsis chorda]
MSSPHKLPRGKSPGRRLKGGTERNRAREDTDILMIEASAQNPKPESAYTLDERIAAYGLLELHEGWRDASAEAVDVLESVTGERYSAVVGKSMNGAAPPVEHQQSRTKRYQCNKCSYAAQYKSRILQHQEVHAERICPTCHRSFYSSKDFHNHTRSHIADEERLTCKRCGNVYKSRFNLRRHMRRTHGEMTQGEFTCEYCERTFDMERGLTIHVKKTHPDQFQARIYECSICGREFDRKNDMRRHEKLHDSSK